MKNQRKTGCQSGMGAKMYQTITAGLSFLLIALLGIGPLTAAEETIFLEGFTDVPLLEGYTVKEEETVIFDTPAGTIAEAYLWPLSGHKAVTSDYYKALLALGWQCKQGQKLNCRKEALLLQISLVMAGENKGALYVKMHPQKHP